MLEKKIEELGMYFDGMFKIKEGYNAVRINIPTNWRTYPKKTDEYEIEPYQVNDNNIPKTLLVGNSNASLNNIMDFAIELILNNLENETKKELYNNKIIELAKIFDTHQLSQLENLVFKFEKPKKIKKIKETKIQLESDITNNDNVNDNNLSLETNNETSSDSEEDINDKIFNAIREQSNKSKTTK